MNQPKRTEKPWGFELLLEVNDYYAVKILTVNPGHRLSLQYHEQKHETLFIQSGNGTVTLNGEEYPANPGDKFVIPTKAIHRTTAGTEQLVILEVSTPHLDDVVRVEDDYARS